MDVMASCVLPNSRATLCVLVTSQLPHLTLGVSQLKHRRQDMLSGSVVVAVASWQGLDTLRTLDPHWPDFKKSTKRLRFSIVAGCMWAPQMSLQPRLLQSGGPRCQPPQDERLRV